MLIRELWVSIDQVCEGHVFKMNKQANEIAYDCFTNESS